MIMEKSFSGNFLIRLDNHPSAESFNQLMNPCWKVSRPDGTILRNFQGICGMISSILHPWVVVGTHGHQRVVLRSTGWSWWDPETDGAMHCNEGAGVGGGRVEGGRQGRMQQFGARCPPIVPAPPQPTDSHWRDRLFVPTRGIFPEPYRNSTPLYSSPQKLRACLVSWWHWIENQPSHLPFIPVAWRWLKELTNDWEDNEIPD